MRYLTKSRFTLALQCPTKLNYSDDPSYANANVTNEFMLALADGGHQVGALAKCIFPEGMEIDALGHDAQVAQTNSALQRDEVVLFEAAIRVGRLFIRTDLLQKRGQRLDLYEVKAKGVDPADPKIRGAKNNFLAEMKPYLYDVAFQRYVLRKAFPDAEIHCHLMMPNKTVICREARLAQRLQITKVDGSIRIEVDPTLRDGAIARAVLHALPVDNDLDELEALPLIMGGWEFSFEGGIEELAHRLDDVPFPPKLGAFCKACQFHATPAELADGRLDGRLECLEKAAGVTPEAAQRGTVLDLYQSRKTDALLAAGKMLLTDLESEDVSFKEGPDEITLSHRQWLQSEEARGALDGAFLRAAAIRKRLSTLSFPLHFIDFETSRPALPFHPNLKPYEQLLFQFSHHRLEADGALRHATQYLAETLNTLPNFDTLRALKTTLSDDKGSVLHWWDHERTVLKEVRSQLQSASVDEVEDRNELIEFVDELVGTDATLGRLFDLGRLIHNTAFFPNTRGSSSIKKLLPAILAITPKLQSKYSAPIYGSQGGIPSLNFTDHTWVRMDDSGSLVDPYLLLDKRSDDPDLSDLEGLEEDGAFVADGGAAMVAYGLLQNGQLNLAASQKLRAQLLRYCELDTLAMVFAWDGVQELLMRDDAVNNA
ncbi:DUF2779 domain-containing protein [Dyella sp. S184]|uniref:DUF2779 domain-containing protein n=1 Tax=Dyella sp. S184 TaxID=1641862 RepID=UPI00131ADCF0|nr:DUF2779 domain-containing protein [Dyella sp. S184]